MNVKTIGSSFLSALIGAALAWLVLGRKPAVTPSSVDVAASNTAEVMRLREQNAKLEAENIRLKAEVATSSTAAAAAAPSPVAANAQITRLQQLADLQKRHLLNMGVTPVDRLGKLTPAFTELFALTPAEQTRVQEVLNKTRERMGELDLANAKVTRNENGSVVVAAGSLAESPQIYDEIMDAFAGALGPDRNAAFLVLGEPQLANAMGQFGAAERTLTVTRIPDPKDPLQSIFSLNEQVRTPRSNMSSSTRYNDMKSLQEKIGPLAKLLPPDFE